jgi:hypothetical protein
MNLCTYKGVDVKSREFRVEGTTALILRSHRDERVDEYDDRPTPACPCSPALRTVVGEALSFICCGGGNAPPSVSTLLRREPRLDRSARSGVAVLKSVYETVSIKIRVEGNKEGANEQSVMERRNGPPHCTSNHGTEANETGVPAKQPAITTLTDRCRRLWQD